ncbi:hypothetical protein JTB14_019251 [Gonioctena quinquepunctata]|nr:hypothetical protein JTB14_019251 [Gonioctena quinquepunctata]
MGFPIDKEGLLHSVEKLVDKSNMKTPFVGNKPEVLALLETDSEVLKFPERVFNMDETCFFLAPKEGLLIEPRGQHVYNESTNSDKENMVTLFAVNAKGQFAPPSTLYTGCSSTK